MKETALRSALRPRALRIRHCVISPRLMEDRAVPTQLVSPVDEHDERPVGLAPFVAVDAGPERWCLSFVLRTSAVAPPFIIPSKQKCLESEHSTMATGIVECYAVPVAGLLVDSGHGTQSPPTTSPHPWIRGFNDPTSVRTRGSELCRQPWLHQLQEKQ